MNIATLLALVLICVCFVRRDNALIYAAFASLAFGTFSIVPAAVSGTTVLASSLLFLLIAVKTGLKADGRAQLLNAAIQLRAMGLLGLFMVIAVVWAMVVPRLSDPDIMVYPMNVGPTSFPVHLQPTGANFNQSIYQVISCLVAVTFFVLARRPGFSTVFLRAIVWGAGAVVLTGVADMIPPLDPLLKMFRTAGYVFLDSAEVLGVSRIIGLMSEASSFGTLAAAFGALLLFSRYAYAPKMRRWVLALSAACLGFAALSTSSAAFLALAAIGGLLAADLFSRLFIERTALKRTAAREAAMLVGLVLLAGLALAMLETQRDFIIRMLDTSLFKKTLSSSYIERSAWTRQALQAFVESGGIGVGVGSVRTSNYFVNILASTGIIGVSVFAAFFLRVMLARVPAVEQQDAELVRGAKMALIVIFVGLYFIGTVPDYGVLVASLFGLICGTAVQHGRRRADAAYALPDAAPLPLVQSLP